MDIDAYAAAHSEEWQRLAQLGKRRRFSGVEADELIDAYQSGASELSAIKATVGESIDGDRLSVALSRARLRFTGASSNVLGRIPTFFIAQLPAALYRIRWVTITVAASTFFIAFLYAWWATANPQVLASLGSTAELEKYSRDDFVNYYSQNSGGTFTGFVWTNNAWIAAQCIAFGIVGVYPAYLLFTTAQQLGFTAAIMLHFDRLDVFFLYIAPHGQLELYSVFTAAAAGLAIFWAWIAPGPRTRAKALAAEGRALFTVVIGLILTLLVSGLIEGWVTRQPWPWPIKIGIGSVALAGFLAYQWLLGGRAYRSGQTGDLDEFEAGARQLISG